MITVRVEVNAMPAGLVFLALVIRAALGVAIVVALVWLVLKLGRLADAYTHKLQNK
jgi:flagellar biogenesis protein FliO